MFKLLTPVLSLHSFDLNHQNTIALLLNKLYFICIFSNFSCASDYYLDFTYKIKRAPMFRFYPRYYYKAFAFQNILYPLLYIKSHNLTSIFIRWVILGLPSLLDSTLTITLGSHYTYVDIRPIKKRTRNLFYSQLIFSQNLVYTLQTWIRSTILSNLAHQPYHLFIYASIKRKAGQ